MGEKKSQKKKSGKSIIFVSHNLRQLEELSELAGRRGTKLLVVVKGYNEWDGMAADLERLNIELILYNKLESGLREIVTKQRYVA